MGGTKKEGGERKKEKGSTSGTVSQPGGNRLKSLLNLECRHGTSRKTQKKQEKGIIRSPSLEGERGNYKAKSAEKRHSSQAEIAAVQGHTRKEKGEETACIPQQLN